MGESFFSLIDSRLPFSSVCGRATSMTELRSNKLTGGLSSTQEFADCERLCGASWLGGLFVEHSLISIFWVVSPGLVRLSRAEL